MIRYFDPVTENFLANLEVSQKRSERYMSQVTSGYRVLKPSDSPDDVVRILNVQNNQQRTEQVQTNLTWLKYEVDTAEKSLSIGVSEMDRALALAAQALGPGQSTESLSALAVQVKTVQDEILGLSQTNVAGRYLFSGDNQSGPQYDRNGTIDPQTGVHATSDYVADGLPTDTRQLLDMFGTSFTAAVTAQEIFDNRDPATLAVTEKNVFAALQKLYNGLTSNPPDLTVVSEAAENIKTASEWLNKNLAFYGGVQRRIAQSTAIAEKYQTQWTLELSELRETDYAEALSSLTAEHSQQQAALQAQAQWAPKSLFDFLK